MALRLRSAAFPPRGEARLYGGKTNADPIKVSAYRHPRNGLLLLVSNLSAKPATAYVDFDAAKLNLKPTKARDPITNEPIALSAQQLRFDMEPFSYRYVWID
jgi:hypothetical protein